MSKTIMTRWGETLDPEHVLEDYPRPGMKRDSFICLNGFWEYAITEPFRVPEQYDGQILVPFSPEAVLSGVNKILTPDMFLHYRKRFSMGKMESGKRLLFSFDITGYVREGENLLQLVVRDQSDSSYHARGKQSLERGGMWYTPQSGIWQSVWMEYVPDHYIEELFLNPDLDRNYIEIRTTMNDRQRMPLELTIRLKDEVILQSEGMTEDTCRIVLPSCECWTPENPVLYDIMIRSGEDEVASYFAMRKISMEKDSKGIYRLFLNNRPYFHTGILDQGYYPDGLYTAPSDEAMVNDILQMKELGFNMLRKHAKIEPDRWYYHCDRLGMLVWQDMVNGGERYKGVIKNTISNLLPQQSGRSRDENLRVFKRDSKNSREEFAREVTMTIRQLYNYPSVVVWTVFNEAWGEFEAGLITKQVRKMDPSRLIDEASGWVDQGGGDISSIHNYFLPLKVKPQDNRCVALSEFGG